MIAQGEALLTIAFPLVIVVHLHAGTHWIWAASILLVTLTLLMAGLLSHRHGRRRYAFLTDQAKNRSLKGETVGILLSFTEEEAQELVRNKDPLFERVIRSGSLPASAYL